MSNCRREKAIFALIDGRLSERRRRELEAHFEQCATCRAYHEKVRRAGAALRALDAQAPPLADWSRMDRVVDQLTQSKARPGADLPWWGWGPAAATALLLAVLGWWAFAPREGQRTTEAFEEPQQAAASLVVPTPEPVEAFVTFVAGRATVQQEERHEAMTLESTLVEGTRLRTVGTSVAGIQMGAGHACRLESEADVELTRLREPSVELELEQGQVRCRTEEDNLPLVLSVMDLVASASGATRFAVQRQPEVVIIDLTEGSLHLTGRARSRDLHAPGRFIFERAAGGAVAVTQEQLGSNEDDEQLAVPLFDGPTISSLVVPENPEVERVRVDGVDLGPLALALRHDPGVARLELFLPGREPVVREIRVGWGLQVVDLAALITEATPQRRPPERTVAPRMGTYDPAQVEELRTLVRRRVRSCYERALLRNPSIWGRIRVGFTVTTSGEPRQVAVENVMGGHELVTECIVQVLEDERFPPPLGGYVPVEQVITLSPQF